MTQTEALKLALEALETCYAGDYSTGHVIDPSFDEDAVKEAIIAIKEALAQPEYQSTADKSQLEKVPAKGTLLAQQCVCGEPNSAGTHRTDGPCLAPQPEQCRKEQRGNGEYVCNCKSGECPELAQPEQESDDLTIAYMAGLSRGKDLASQRTWVGLTDEEKSDLWEISRAALPRYATYATLVEAKFKEKNA